MHFVIKAPLPERMAKTLAFKSRKTMYGGRRISVGDRIYLFHGVQGKRDGLFARGRVTAAKTVPRRPGVARQTPRVSIAVSGLVRAKRRLSRADLMAFSAWGDGRPQTELNFKLYRQATDKLVGVSDTVARFLDRHFDVRS